MARPERNNVDYFPHEVNHGKKMFFIRQKYKNDGYATWFLILEELGKSDNHYLNLSNPTEMMYLAAQCMITEELLKNILTDLSILGAINKKLWDEYLIIWSEKFMESISDAYKHRNNKCMTLEGLIQHLLGLGIVKQGFNPINNGINTQRIGKDSIGKKKKVIDYANDFLNFWNLYPKKVGKGKAFQEWKHLLETDKEKIPIALSWQQKSEQWCDKNGKYIPHPSTYLNQRRWEDELTIIQPKASW